LWFGCNHDCLLPTLGRAAALLRSGSELLFVALAALRLRILAALRAHPRQNSPIEKDPDFHLFPIGRRVRDFVWEVMLQAKVIRERPLAGMAHALVFWAFCAFALVTLNHCATNLGLGFLDPAGRVGRLYFDFAAIFAIGLRVGILGLFVRRFLVRPKWLGELSWGVRAGLRF
jgi:hypothetical protein